MYVLNNTFFGVYWLRLESFTVIGWKIRNIFPDRFLISILCLNFPLKASLSEWALVISFQILTLCISISSPWFCKVLCARHYKQAAVCILFTPFFTAVYIVEQLVLQTIYVLKKEKDPKIAVYNWERLIIKSGL